jgi:hypothetical protein
MKKISSEKTVDRDGIPTRVITYDDGTVQELPVDPAAVLKTDRWKEKAGGAIGLNDDGTKVTDDEVQALRKRLYGDKKK